MDSFEATVSGNPVYTTSYVRDHLGRIVQKVETIEGATATYDYVYDAAGFIPFWDPFKDTYNPCQNGLWLSKKLGGYNFDLVATAVGLRAAAWLGRVGTGTKWGHWINHNKWLRAGPGHIPGKGVVPRISIGPHYQDLPQWWLTLKHIQLDFFGL